MQKSNNVFWGSRTYLNITTEQKQHKQIAKSGPSKEATANIFFFSVYVIVTTCFHKCFFFHMITGRYCFFQKFIDTLRFLHRPCSCTLWSKWFERSPYFIFYLHNKSKMLIPKWEALKWSSGISYLLNVLYYFFKKLKTSLEAFIF